MNSSLLNYGPITFLHEHLFSSLLETHNFLNSANEHLYDDDDIYKFSEVRTMRIIMWMTIFINFLYMLLKAHDLWLLYREKKRATRVRKTVAEIEILKLELEGALLAGRLIKVKMMVGEVGVLMSEAMRLAEGREVLMLDHRSAREGDSADVTKSG